MDFTTLRFIIGCVGTLLVVAGAYLSIKGFKKQLTVRFMANTAIFAAFSVILYIVPMLNLPFPFFPGFLKVHFDEVPAFIAGFAYGPLSALFVIIIKTLVKLPLTSTLGFGEFIDFLYSCAFVIPAAIIYQKKKNLKGALLGFGVATVIQLFVSSFMTTFVMLDFYMVIIRLPKEAIINMCKAANPLVDNLEWKFLFFVALPFNAFKDVMVFLLTFILYKFSHRLIDRLSAQKN